MEYKAIIFDLDGVILSTDEYHYKAWKSLADEYNIPFDKNINNRLRGISRMDSLEIILEKYTKPITEEEKFLMSEKKNQMYKNFLTKLSPNDIESSVKKTLLELKRKGYKIAIGSSSQNAKFILEQTELINLFDGISDGTNIEKSKPDPEVFLKAADIINVDYNLCAVIEDAEAGIESAKSAGMFAIGMGDAYNYYKADRSILNLSELLEIF